MEIILSSITSTTNPIPKKFKKNDILFNEGDPIQSLLIVQTGKIKGVLPRAKGNVEVLTLNGPCVLGEMALSGVLKQNFTAMALNDVTALEIPLEGTKSVIENGSQIIKLLIKSIVDQEKNLFNEVKIFKLESDSSPCPVEIIPRLFGGIFHFINHIGKRESDGRVLVQWLQMKQYTSRIFNLQTEKVENVCQMLAKFGWVDFIIEKPEDDPEAPEQLMKIYFKNVNQIESFFEYYQYFSNKSGKQEFLKPEETMFHLIRGILHFGLKETPDKNGNVRFLLNPLLEMLKKDFNISISASSWTMLENKGLFCRRQQMSDGQFFLSFALDEFERTYNAWRFIREINKWNVNGSVNAKEPEFVLAPANANGATTATAVSSVPCPACQAQVQSNQKFCGECGAKILQQAA
jgi:hypothetical protein